MFVSFRIDADLGEHGLDGRSLRRDQVMAGEFAIPTAPQRLAIDRDLREGGGVDAALNPPREDHFELLGIEPPHGARPGGNRGRFVASEAPGVGLGCAICRPNRAMPTRLSRPRSMAKATIPRIAGSGWMRPCGLRGSGRVASDSNNVSVTIDTSRHGKIKLPGIPTPTTPAKTKKGKALTSTPSVSWT